MQRIVCLAALVAITSACGPHPDEEAVGHVHAYVAAITAAADEAVGEVYAWLERGGGETDSVLAEADNLRQINGRYWDDMPAYEEIESWRFEVCPGDCEQPREVDGEELAVRLWDIEWETNTLANRIERVARGEQDDDSIRRLAQMGGSTSEAAEELRRALPGE